MPTRKELKQLQSLPLEVKIKKSQQRIREWVEYYGENGVYVSFSGGKDSTVLLDIVRKMYPGIEAVFVNTGLEYPEIVDFVKRFDNVTILIPKKNFRQVLTEYGYPVISKEVSATIEQAKQTPGGAKYQRLHGTSDSGFDFSRYLFLEDAPFKISDRCCKTMKKNPANTIKKARFTGTMAEESKLRESSWLRFGCNSFDSKHPNSSPISFWTNNDILTYIHTHNLSIASVYGDVVPDDQNQIHGQVNIYDITGDYRGCKYRTTGCERTGCMFCLFGAHLEKGEGRLERMKRTHPKRYGYVMGGGEFDSDGMWVPNGKGLGFKFVVDWINKHGNLNIRY